MRAKPTIQKMLPAYSPALDWAKPTGMKPTTVTSVPESMGAAVWLQAKAAAWMRSMPSSIFTTIISMAMMASSTSRPRARMRAPSEMRSNMPGIQHDDKDHRQGERNGGGDDDADAPAEADQAHQQHDAERHEELEHELVDGLTDVDRLIRHLAQADAERQAVRDGLRLGLERLAEVEPVPAVPHDHAEHESGLALVTD